MKLNDLELITSYHKCTCLSFKETKPTMTIYRLANFTSPRNCYLLMLKQTWSIWLKKSCMYIIRASLNSIKHIQKFISSTNSSFKTLLNIEGVLDIPVPRWHFCISVSCMYQKFKYLCHMVDHCLRSAIYISSLSGDLFTFKNNFLLINNF